MRRPSSKLVMLALALPSTLCAREAQAHLVQTGLGPVYDGVAHFALSPEDFLPILGAALVAGLRGKEHARVAVVLLPLFWLLGGVLGGLPHTPVLTAPSWALFMVVGALVAADLRLPIAVTGALIALLGLVLGYSNGLAMAESGQGMPGVIGSTAAIFVLVTFVAALAVATTIAWVRIAWRVAGIWIAASGLLLLGWALKAR